LTTAERQRDYETMIVLRADLQEGGAKEQLERLTKLLEANGATVRGVHEWGLRELAYLVKKERRGFYALIEYTSATAALLELERQMKLSDAVLRYVSVRQEYPVEVPAAKEQPETAPAPAATEVSSAPEPDAEAATDGDA
jgi:small subunit ribosomal protein S6